MKKLLSIGLSLGLLYASVGNAAELTKKKLQVFILAGQSNMVGHANYLTIPALLTVEDPRAKALAALLFKEGAIAPGMTRELLETRFKKAALANDLKQKKIVGEKQIAAAQADLAKLRAAQEAKIEKIKKAFKVSERVYISSIADGHRRSGPLTFGYGGGAGEIGPELGFGLALERAVDAPILLIKTSWGGKSLHYDFRPPSAGAYEFDEKQKKFDTDEYKQAWAKAQEEYTNVWIPKTKKTIAAFWVEHDKFMVKHLNKEQYAEWQKVAADWHASVVSPGNGGPDNLRPWKVWALERTAQKYFAGTEVKSPTMDFNNTHWKERPALANAPTAQAIRGNAGHFYRMMNEAVREVLRDLKKAHPEYDADDGHEMAGFVWFQGFNDQFSDAFHGNYKTNMVAFIKDVRKEYKVPNMPFVVGVLGTGGTKEKVDMNPVSAAQRAAAAAPEFEGNVASVESYPFAELKAAGMWGNRTWNKPEHRVEFSMVASDRPYHYMGSGRFFVQFGAALADAMAALLKKQK
jgi:hypothetical protein